MSIWFVTIKERFDRLKNLIAKVNLSDAMIDYHARWASFVDSDNIKDHSDKYLILLCFLIRQVRLRHDFLIDTYLQCVKAAENQAKNLQQEEYFKDQRQRKKATQLLINSRQKYRQQVEEIKNILKTLPVIVIRLLKFKIFWKPKMNFQEIRKN